MGSNAVASGGLSTSIGYVTVAKGYCSTVVGMWNDSLLTTDQLNPTTTTPLFIVGNGTTISSRSNAMVVSKDGKIYADPNGKNTGELNDNALVFGAYNNTGEGIASKRTVGGNQFGLDFYTSYINRLSITNNGNVGIGTDNPGVKLQVNGNICYTGSIAACSDIRYKKNIQSLSPVLPSILSLHGIYYNWNKEKFPDKAFGDERQIGFSAQEVEKYFPEIVQTDGQGYKAVDYGRLTPVLVEAMKEQQVMIGELKLKAQKIDQQQQQIDDLQKEIQLIKAKLK